MDILEHLGMKVPDIEGHGVIISRASGPLVHVALMAGLACYYLASSLSLYGILRFLDIWSLVFL